MPGSERILQVTWRDGLSSGGRRRSPPAWRLAIRVTITAGVVLGPASAAVSSSGGADLAGANWGLRLLDADSARGAPGQTADHRALVGHVAITFMLRVIAHIHLTPFGLYRLLFALLLWRSHPAGRLAAWKGHRVDVS